MSRQIAKFGWVRDLPDPRDLTYSAPLGVLKALPPRVEIAIDIPVYDQGRIGSCTANALATAFEYDRIKNGQVPDFLPSRLFIYYNERAIEGSVAYDAGAQIRDGIKTLVSNGVCNESDWPYDDTPADYDGGPFPVGSRPATKPSQRCYDLASNFQVTTYQRLSQTLFQLQGCLAAGFPFVFGFTVFESWAGGAGLPEVVPMPSNNDRVLGGHAVLCVGYDNATQLFKFRNSWGSAVGEGGYFFMPYAYMTNSNLCADFWVINAVEA